MCILLDSELVIITIPLGRTLLGNLVSSLVWVPIKCPKLVLTGPKGVSYSVGFSFPRLLCNLESALSWWIFPLPLRSWDSSKALTFPSIFLESPPHDLIAEIWGIGITVLCVKWKSMFFYPETCLFFSHAKKN